MRGLNNKVNSNRQLSKRFKKLVRMNFCGFHPKFISKISCLRKIPFDLHKILPTETNYIYRACLNEMNEPFDSINRIQYNPNPQYISRANVKGQGIGYYACALDIAVIESCQDQLRNTAEREFNLTVSKWKVQKNLSTQIVCNNQKTQQAGTDLGLFCQATLKKRKADLEKKHYRTYFLKTRFLSDQYAKTNIKFENDDYLISALHSKTLLNPNNNIDCIIYPSVGYRYLGFNYALPPRVFNEEYLELREVFNVNVEFDMKNFKEYPSLNVIKSSNTFDKENDKIIW
jgi:hypothetical protein